MDTNAIGSGFHPYDLIYLIYFHKNPSSHTVTLGMGASMYNFGGTHSAHNTVFKLSLLFSCSVMSDSVQPWGLQHARLPCPSLSICLNHVHWVGDAIQPLLLPYPCALSLSQHQGLFQWVSSSHQVAKVLELQLQHQSRQWIFRVDFL